MIHSEETIVEHREFSDSIRSSSLGDYTEVRRERKLSSRFNGRDALRNVYANCTVSYNAINILALVALMDLLAKEKITLYKMQRGNQEDEHIPNKIIEK